MRKLLTIILLVTLAVSLLAGCGQSEYERQMLEDRKKAEEFHKNFYKKPANLNTAPETGPGIIGDPKNKK